MVSNDTKNKNKNNNQESSDSSTMNVLSSSIHRRPSITTMLTTTVLMFALQMPVRVDGQEVDIEYPGDLDVNITKLNDVGGDIVYGDTEKTNLFDGDQTTAVIDFEVGQLIRIEVIPNGNEKLEHFNVMTTPDQIRASWWQFSFRDKQFGNWHEFDSDLRDSLTNIVEYLSDISSADVYPFADIYRFEALFNDSTAVSLTDLTVTVDRTNNVTFNPTLPPSKSPTSPPTGVTTLFPTIPPTPNPTDYPSVPPTMNPTLSPTWARALGKTRIDFLFQNWNISDNVYPLAERNQTYATFTVPAVCQNRTVEVIEEGTRTVNTTERVYNSTSDTYYNISTVANETYVVNNYTEVREVCKNPAYCATCILAWSDIDATIEAVGCMDKSMEEPLDGLSRSEFYECNGTWRLTSTARLVSFQQTYGRVEVWEVDEDGLKWLQFFFEFQWNTSLCLWTDRDGNQDKCELLPLTTNAERAVRFVFEMPKFPADSRTKPLIVVWSDLLAIPYSLQPPLNYTFTNLTEYELVKGQSFRPRDLLEQSDFQAPFYILMCLVGIFLVLMIMGCVRITDHESKYNYLIDTRNLRSTFKHKKERLILEEEFMHSRSKFSCLKHGPYFCVVLCARIAYMIIFTFSFFVLTFTEINRDHFHTIEQYSDFADNRDGQLLNMSQTLEDYYNNETDRMEAELAHRQYHCYDLYLNLSQAKYRSESLATYLNHSYQMQAPLNRTALTVADITDFTELQGNNQHCNVDQSDGAVYLEKDVIYLLNGSGIVKAWDYNRSMPEWTENVYEPVNEKCLSSEYCIAWTWIDGNLTENRNNSIVLLQELADPVLDYSNDTTGLCYRVVRADTSLFSAFDSIDSLANFTANLEASYLRDYTSAVDGVYNSLSGIWDMLKGMSDEDNRMTYNVQVENDPSLEDYDVDFLLQDYDLNTFEFTWLVLIRCPGCPEGNFTSPELEEVFDYLEGYNYTNLTQLIVDANRAANNGSDDSFNISDYISLQTSLLDEPAIPTIDLPLSVKIPNIDYLPGVWVSLDTILFVYRTYRTMGMLSTVVRGKDVEVSIKYLMVRGANGDIDCCPNGMNLMDRCLSCFIWCTGKFDNITYLFWKMWFFFILMFELLLVLLFTAALYLLIDTVIDKDFIEALGIFDLMTSGLATQRTTRNQVICSTAASYNNYTLSQMSYARTLYIAQRNLRAFNWNRQEFDRVENWNFQFCNAWGAYMASVRDVTVDGNRYLVSSESDTDTGLGTNAMVDYLYDKNEDTSFTPFPVISESLQNNDTLTTVHFELPLMTLRELTDNTSYWQVSYIELDWSYDASNSFYSSGDLSIPFDFDYRLNEADAWVDGGGDVSEFTTSTDVSRDNVIQRVSVDWSETRYVRMNIPNSGQWRDAIQLNGITVFGSIPEDNIECDYVEYYYWDFDASKVESPLCPGITPIHGIMYRGFVRVWLADQLFEFHIPFINAIRNICLSPFFIFTVALIALACVQVFGFILEWFLLLVDLYRENPFGKIPIVHPRFELQESVFQDMAEVYIGATVNENFDRVDIVDDFTAYENVEGILGSNGNSAQPMSANAGPATGIQGTYPIHG